MKDQEKTNEKPSKADLEEEVNTDNTDDLSLFIQKAQLQNKVLEKLVEDMELSLHDYANRKNKNH